MKHTTIKRLRSANPPFKYQLGGATGFTLIEVIVSSLILVIAVVGSIAGVNLLVQSVRGTDLRAAQSRRIDRDISRITDISEVYNACTVSTGSLDPCPGFVPGNSYYYFPQADPDVDPQPITDFEGACETGAIVDQFIAEIEGLDPPGGGVVRNTPLRLGTGTNHLVEVTWEGPNGELRTKQFIPLVSAWCP